MNKKALRVRIYATKDVELGSCIIEKVAVPVDALPAFMLLVPDSGCLVTDVVEAPVQVPNS